MVNPGLCKVRLSQITSIQVSGRRQLRPALPSALLEWIFKLSDGATHLMSVSCLELWMGVRLATGCCTRIQLAIGDIFRIGGEICFIGPWRPVYSGVLPSFWQGVGFEWF